MLLCSVNGVYVIVTMFYLWDISKCYYVYNSHMYVVQLCNSPAGM